MIGRFLIILVGLGFSVMAQAGLLTMTLQIHNHSKHDTIYPQDFHHAYLDSDSRLGKKYIAPPCGSSRVFTAVSDSLIDDQGKISFALYADYVGHDKFEEYFLGRFHFEHDAGITQNDVWSFTQGGSPVNLPEDFEHSPFKVKVTNPVGPGSFGTYQFHIDVYPINKSHLCS